MKCEIITVQFFGNDVTEMDIKRHFSMVSDQEKIKGKEKAYPIHTHSMGSSSRVIFKTTDPKDPQIHVAREVTLSRF